jgi:peptide-methionine (S)-S-oxide reductase
VQITFDPSQISYRDMLVVFFNTHDPTTLNRQGEDVGTQYRSVIYYHSPEQKKVAEEVIAELKSGDRPLNVVTQLEPAPAFYKAEDYHQGYFRNNPGQGYCQYVVAPKVAKLYKNFKEIVAR